MDGFFEKVPWHITSEKSLVFQYKYKYLIFHVHHTLKASYWDDAQMSRTQDKLLGQTHYSLLA